MPDEWLHLLAPQLRLEELHAVSQTSQALRAAARALPAAVWRQSRERTMPGYHPLSGAQDVWAAADSLWRGCASLVHGETYAGTISADSDLTAATLLQPDFRRRLTLEPSPAGVEQVQLWTDIRITLAGQHLATRSQVAQLPAQDCFWFPDGASSPCGEYCLLLSRSPAGLTWHTWAASSAAIVSLYHCPEGVATSISWLPGCAPARLVCERRHTLPESSASSGSDDGVLRETVRYQIQVLAPNGRLLAQSEAWNKHHCDSDPVFRSAASPDGACLAAFLERELVVFALADCSVLFWLPWGPVYDHEDHPAYLKLWWSPDSLGIYIGSTEQDDHLHAVCSLQSRCWLRSSQDLLGLHMYDYVVGWAPLGLLTRRLSFSSADTLRVGADTLRVVQPFYAPGVELAERLGMNMEGQIEAAVFSPGCTWIAFTVMQAVDEMTWRGPRSMLGVFVVRCSTFELAAQWRPYQACRGLSVAWAAQGNRLCCRCSDPCAEELLTFGP